MPETPKESSKTVDRFTVTLDLQNDEESALFQARNRQLRKKFPDHSP